MTILTIFRKKVQKAVKNARETRIKDRKNNMWNRMRENNEK